ncbi:DUF4133 domain-containing protein [Puia dinghuensis]|uniref:Transposase n=1 Tax=Puia dinghuensis TaxID=1792502 RepID=A0A8J2UJA5_9BACT|nr:DUF4133 domain-containing protein [Puia dinghuensis]GGB23863.1 transposase [Puia dinghuensis]
MTTSVYPNYRAMSRPITFKGFRGQYILVAAASLVIDLLLFVILYCCGVTPLICILLVFGLGAAALWTTARLSRRFGAHGLMKHFAAKRVPRVVRFNSRRVYFNLIK